MFFIKDGRVCQDKCVSFLILFILRGVSTFPKQLDTNLPSIHYNLTLTYHNPNGVMRLSENFLQKSL